MTGTKQAKGDDSELNQQGRESNPPNSDDSSKDLSSLSKLKGLKGMKSVKNGSMSKSEKKQGSKIDNEEFIDINEYSLGGMKYKLPGKRQRIIIASIVLGLNILLVLAVILYFKNPNFQEFIYHVGRDV